MELLLKWAIGWLIGWGGLSLIVAACAGALWWFLPAIFVKGRALAFNVAIGALAFNSVYSMGFKDGASTTKAEWTAAEQRAVERGTSLHEKAEREIPPVVEPAPVVCPEPAPAGGAKPARRAVPVPRWMRDDRHNRDNDKG